MSNRVQHKTFGKGTIVQIASDTITVKFDDGTRKEFVRKNFEDYFTYLPNGSAPHTVPLPPQEHTHTTTTHNGNYPEVVYATTNADFLNKRFGTNYKAWMKCTWPYNDNTAVWMLDFTGVGDAGWDNRIVDANTVREEYIGFPMAIAPIKENRRIIVKKEKEFGRYVILGLYRYDFENSHEPHLRIWKKVKDFI